MAAPDQGHAQIAHAIRRSAALDAALRFCATDAPMEVVLETADRFAKWIRGTAGQRPTDFLGKDPWAED